jgi:phosphate transport system substrate-binding protein
MANAAAAKPSPTGLRRRALLGWMAAAGAIAPDARALAPGPLRGAGATFPAPLLQRWAEAYHEARGEAVRYEAVGSGQGVERVERGEVDFGVSDAPLPEAECARAGLLQFPAAIGAVVPVVNLAGIGPGSLRLDAPTLGAIYRGRIRRWDDAAIAARNPGRDLPGTRITTVHRADASGTTWLFSSWLSRADPGWSAALGHGLTLAWPADDNAAAGTGNEGVASLVRRTRAAIGYVEYTYARRHGLADVALPAHDGPVVRAGRASFEAAVAAAHWRNAADLEQSLVDVPGAQSWPIVGASFVLVPAQPPDPERTRAVLRFFRWALAEGGALAAALDYVALPAPAVRLVDALLRDHT